MWKYGNSLYKVKFKKGKQKWFSKRAYKIDRHDKIEKHSRRKKTSILLILGILLLAPLNIFNTDIYQNDNIAAFGLPVVLLLFNIITYKIVHSDFGKAWRHTFIFWLINIFFVINNFIYLLPAMNGDVFNGGLSLIVLYAIPCVVAFFMGTFMSPDAY